jgi:hypothetical protein
MDTVVHERTAGTPCCEEGRALRPAPPAFGSVTAEEATWSRAFRQRMTPWWRTFCEQPAQTPLTRRIDDHRWVGDKLIDDVAEMFQRVGVTTGRAMFDQALEHGIDAVEDAPEELRALLRQLDHEPEWFDRDLWERGRRIWVRSTVFGKLGEFSADIVLTAMTYEVGSAVGSTGRFVRDPLRRNLETMTFFHDMTRAGAMERHSEEFKQAVRVRLMHGQVRRGLRKSWGEERLAFAGDPISNAAMAQAVAAFGVSPLALDHSFGRPLAKTDLDAVVMYWAYIVYICGVCEHIIPKNADEAFELGDHMLYTGAKHSQWSPELAQSFVRYFDNLADGPLLVRLIGRQLVLPALYGFLTQILGEPMMREFVRETEMLDAPLRRWSYLVGIVVRASAVGAGVLDAAPLIGAYRRRTAPEVDPFFAAALARLRSQSQQRGGPTRATYTGHDHTTAADLTAPSVA